MSSCYPFYRANLPECPEEIIVQAHLTPITQYTWTITDRRFGTQYIGQATTDRDGTIIIDTTGAPFPPGLFNRHAGVFELSVKEDPAQCAVTGMTLCVDELTSEVFDTVQMSFFESISEDTQQAIVGCDCTITP